MESTGNDKIRREFAEKATELSTWLTQETQLLAETSGELEDQLNAIQGRVNNLPAGKATLDAVAGLASTMMELEIPPSGKYTNLDYQSLKAQFEELVASQQSKQKLIEKEILLKQNSKASPQQIDEFKEVFTYFDKNKSGSLSRLEFKSCLQSLGEDPSDAELNQLIAELGDGSDKIGFDRFVDFMIRRASDSNSSDEILASFSELANGKVLSSLLFFSSFSLGLIQCFFLFQ